MHILLVSHGKLCEGVLDAFSMLVSGCKNISRIRRIDAHRALAEDWGLVLETPRLADDITHVGIRMHDILPGEGENSFRCRVTEEIENPFSFTLMLRPVDCPDAMSVGWETDKAAWRALRADEVTIRLPKESLLLLKE